MELDLLLLDFRNSLLIRRAQVFDDKLTHILRYFPFRILMCGFIGLDTCL